MFSGATHLRLLWSLLLTHLEKDQEPTNGLEPLACLLRVISQALQRLAWVCKFRISKSGSPWAYVGELSRICLHWCRSGVLVGGNKSF